VVDVTSGYTKSGFRWFLRGTQFFYLDKGGQLRPWPTYWGKPRTSLELTPAEKRRAEDRERRHRETPAKVARLREIARQFLENGERYNHT
jgi:hypothetical protein